MKFDHDDIKHDFLTMKGTCSLLNVSASCLWKIRKREDFPSPYQIGARKLRWKRAEIETWLETRRQRGKEEGYAV